MAENKYIQVAEYLSGNGGALCTRPDREKVTEILDILRELVFPIYFSGKTCDSCEYAKKIETAERLLSEQITYAGILTGSEYSNPEKAGETVSELIMSLPRIKELLKKDAEAGVNGDPAAKGFDDIILSYPGMYAIFVYRIAHVLYMKNVPIIPRMMTEQAHSLTGIDINAGAEIGEYFFIDHGTGVVIGETTVIGNRVKLYQGVTLGALSTRKSQQLKGKKRHPTIMDNVTVYSNATILGGETVIGENAIIGGSAFVTKSVPANTKVIVKNQELILKDPKGNVWEI